MGQGQLAQRHQLQLPAVHPVHLFQHRTGEQATIEHALAHQLQPVGRRPEPPIGATPAARRRARQPSRSGRIEAEVP
jgi:hypothetical protein